ncbi:MAG: methyltransferase domain-containing protein [Proteobacteria bacterium]|nr:methyltransferase domain-containing protein [Pseudomonadota bacterium]NIS68581.1 methyltransferase domain-containing protein [Pseudomonadota bacterium]
MGSHVCPWWLAYTFDNPLRALFHRSDQIFSSFVKEGMTVADIGCGMGYFSIGLAKIVKENGKVIAVDIQTKILEVLEKRARSAGVSDIVQTRLCKENEIGIPEPIDFALTFWMVHEAPEIKPFLQQINDILKDSGLLLIAEPKLHVSRSQFEHEIDIARDIGFRIKDEPKISFSHSVLLEKAEDTRSINARTY